MTLEKAILLAMIEASFKDRIIDEVTYKKILPIGTLVFKRHIVPYLKGEYGFNFTYNIYVDM